MKIYKTPTYEDDSYHIQLQNVKLDILDYKLNKMRKLDEYLDTKIVAFANKDINPMNFIKYKDTKKSLADVENINKLTGTIYTFSVEQQNFMSYDNIIKKSKEMYENNPNDRRNVIRIANDFKTYSESKVKNIDVSCLNLIQIFNKHPKIVFRASDIQNELFVDIITIFLFFINKIMGSEKIIDIDIISLTSQNVSHFAHTAYQLRKGFEHDNE